MADDLINRLIRAALASEGMGREEIIVCETSRSDDWHDARLHVLAALQELSEADLREILAQRARKKLRTV